MVSWRMSSQTWIRTPVSSWTVRTETCSQEAAGGEIHPPWLGWWVEGAGSSPAAGMENPSPNGLVSNDI